MAGRTEFIRNKFNAQKGMNELRYGKLSTGYKLIYFEREDEEPAVFKIHIANYD